MPGSLGKTNPPRALNEAHSVLMGGCETAQERNAASKLHTVLKLTPSVGHCRRFKSSFDKRGKVCRATLSMTTTGAIMPIAGTLHALRECHAETP